MVTYLYLLARYRAHRTTYATLAFTLHGMRQQLSSTTTSPSHAAACLLFCSQLRRTAQHFSPNKHTSFSSRLPARQHLARALRAATSGMPHTSHHFSYSICWFSSITFSDTSQYLLSLPHLPPRLLFSILTLSVTGQAEQQQHM